MRIHFFLLLLCNMCQTLASSCQSDRDKDHRPRVSCTGMGLSSVPSEIDSATEVIVLKDNEFATMSWTSYTGFSKLYEIDLSQNKVTSLEEMPDIILPSLKVLNLTENKLEKLPASAFVAASNLMEIYLRANQLHTLSEESFKGLDDLEVLDLSQNLIQVLPHSLLTVMTTTKLKTFDVEDNRLKFMPDQFFSRIPEIPYVYLSKNPWVCSCKVEYLSTWLEDQGHNVYEHTGPSNIVNDPERVVCASPSRLKGQTIIDLQRDDYCSPSGDIDAVEITTVLPQPVQTTILIPFTSAPPLHTDPMILSTVKILPSTQTAKPTHIQIPGSMTKHTQTTDSPQALTTWTWTSWYLESITEFVTSKISYEKVIEAIPTITSILPSTFQYTTKQLPTTTSTTISIPRTITSSRPTATTSIPTITSRPTANPTTTLHLTTAEPSLTTERNLTVGSVGLAMKRGEKIVVLYCWWLFIGYLCLCVLLGLWLCILSIWILRTYLRVYLPLVRQTQGQKGETLRLLGYKARQQDHTEGTKEKVGWAGKENAKVGPISLPFEGTEGVQAMFRSVLFVYKEREEGGNLVLESEEARKDERETVKYENVRKADVPATSKESVKEGIGRAQTGGTEKQSVYRKTLYKVVSREEDITAWKDGNKTEKPNEAHAEEGIEKMMHGWSEKKRRTSESKKRYSLILREERLEGEELDKRRESSVGNEWVVGEWMLRDRGSEGEREEDWWSLMPLISRGIDGGPKDEDNATANGSSSETYL